MDALKYVERNEDKLYCFIEVCQTIFPDIPKSTVRNWLKSLSIATSTCVAEEREFFRKQNPSLGGTFGLIEHRDLLRLIDYRSSGVGRKRARLTIGCTVTDVVPKPTSTVCSSESMNSGNLANIVGYSESSEEESEPKMMQDVRAEVTSQEVDVKQSPKKKYRCQLHMDEAPKKLKGELTMLRNFYRKELNPSRKGGPYSPVTIEKMSERVMCFMFYCKNVKNISDLALSLYCNVDLFTEYLEHLKHVRKLKPSTIVAHLIISINVVKYCLAMRDPPITNPGESREVRAYQSFQRQFQREGNMLSKCNKEGLLSSKSAQQFYFAHILETLRNLRDKYFEASGLAKFRLLHDFVLLATYLRAIPGRSKELRTMRLYVESEENEPFDYTSMEASNFIVFEQDKRVTIVQFDFKTCKSIGPTKVDLSEDSDLVYFLQLYINARPSLLLGKTHDFCFLNRNGAPFDSSGSIAKYLGDIFEREVSIRASTNSLRHAIVTYFTSLEESKDIDIRKSLALLMKHSVRHQESTYNDLTHHEKTQKGRDLIRQKLASNIFGELDSSGPSGSAIYASDGSQSDDESELKPVAGDMVALLDPISTKENIHFFLAKVARLSQNRKEAHLIHLENVEDSNNLYRLKPGKSWRESLRSLIYPIDLVYNASSRAYELRTLPRDIFDIVHGKE